MKTTKNNDVVADENKDVGSKIDIDDFMTPKDMVFFLRKKRTKTADLPDLEQRVERQMGGKDTGDTTGAYNTTVWYENRFNAKKFANIVQAIIKGEME